MVDVLKNIRDFFANRLDKQYLFYFVLFVLFLPYYASFILMKESGIMVLVANVFVIYILSLFLTLFPKFLRCILQFIVGAYYFIFSLLSFYGVYFLKNRDALYVLSLILQSNKNEASQFISMYVDCKAVIFTIVLFLFEFALIAIVLLCRRKFVPRLKRQSKLLFVVMNVICCLAFVVPQIYFSTPVFSPFEKSHDNFISRDIKEFQINPCIEKHVEMRPQYVVLVVGESFSKSHSSLYGYDMTTNPKLKILQDTGKLFVFQNVTCSHGATGMSFKDIMSTYSSRNPDEDWTKCITIPTVMKYEGYYTIWVSNQQCSGLWDAIPEQYSKLCDKREFTKPGINHDGMLLPIIEKHIINTKCMKRVFMVVHLMGSHEEFDLRYPDDFEVFQPSDYLDYPANQREQRAKYDNAILYNDYVVNKIIDLFSNENTILFYYPDHALDVYESDPSYVGHSTADNKSVEVCKQIPFVIYVSDTYKQRYPENVQRIYSSVNNTFCTQDFIYSLMDITGYKFSANNNVCKYSLFYE